MRRRGLFAVVGGMLGGHVPHSHAAEYRSLLQEKLEAFDRRRAAEHVDIVQALLRAGGIRPSGSSPQGRMPSADAAASAAQGRIR